MVAHLDRFGRSLLEGLVAIERIEKAGGTFASVNDGFDLATDTGRLVMRVMLSMAEWQGDRVRESWDAARERAVARGVHCASRPPTGYQRGPSRRLGADRATGAMITDLFARRAEGEAIISLCRCVAVSLCRWLEARGARRAHAI